jgi:hypothetical protein
MKYNLYRTEITDVSISFIKSEKINVELDTLLNRIQSHIIDIYQRKQEKEHGIKSLGNDMRYSIDINSELENNSIEAYIIKFTENNRYFLSKFIEVTLNTNEKEIYFLILHNDFGRESKLVDNSFIRIEQVKKDLISFFNIYKPRINLPEISFIEVTAFSNHFFENRGGFNFIYKMK